MKTALIRYKENGQEYVLEGEGNEIIPDVKKNETHGYQSNVTQMALEDGSVISEHVIQQPITVSLQFVETNSTTNGTMVNRKSTFDKLVEIWKNKTVCQLITEHEIYENMVVQNMPIQHSAPYRGSLNVQCEFTQLSFATPNRVAYAGKDAGLTKSSSQTVTGGYKKMKLT